MNTHGQKVARPREATTNIPTREREDTNMNQPEVQTQTQPEPMNTVGYEAAEMKFRQEDSETVVSYGKPTTATLLDALSAGGDIGALVEHCFDLGYRSQIRNHAKAGRGSPANLMDAVRLAAEAAENRGGSGEALARYRAGVTAFVAWAKAAGKSAKAQAIIKQLATNTKALALQPESIRGRMEANVNAWSETLTDAQLTEHELTLTRLIEACAGVELDAEDF